MTTNAMWKALAKKIDADDREELKHEINKLLKLLARCGEPLGNEWNKSPLPYAHAALEDVLHFLRLAAASASTQRRILIQERQP